MVTANISRIDQARDFIGLLKSLQQQKIDADLTITSKYRQGLLHVREGLILSAHSGILHGNGAVLTLAQMEHSLIEITPATGLVPRTVYISLEQLERFLSTKTVQSVHGKHCDEERLLQEAIDLFFRFEYKQAVEKLVTILRHNRFFYPAWLWQSRILTRQDYIAKALDEAYRWGNHDQDVWREGRKLRPHLSEGEAGVKRCYFCWSILTEPAFCEHCHAHLAISGHILSTDLRVEEIKFALSHFTRALQLDKSNARIAFTLALGYFNLGEYQRALNYMRLAANLSPQTPHYAKSLTTLMAVARYQAAPDKESCPVSTNIRKGSRSILMVEDSITSRKVLSTLFNRHGYHTLEAASGVEAVEIAKKNRPDIILLDVMLPDTNGHELLERLHALDHLSKVPVIMLTGRHDAKDKMKGLQGGVSEYLTKPVSPQRLIEVIQSYLQPDGSAVDGRQIDQTGTASTGLPASPVAVTPALPAQRPVQTSSEPPSAAQAIKNGGKSIFVIEDSRTSRKVLAMLLGRNGYRIHEASTGMAALQLAHDIKPDLVLLDVQLPDTTGYTILPQLKKLPHFAHLPVIMLTGKREAKDRMQGMLAGTNEYLTKPFDPQKLLSVINGYLQV